MVILELFKTISRPSSGMSSLYRFGFMPDNGFGFMPGNRFGFMPG